MLNDEAQAAATTDSTEAIASGAPPTSESPMPANAMADPAPANQDGAFDDQVWPDEWRDDAPNSVDNFFAHVRSEEAYWDSHGWPCHRAAPDGSNRLLRRRYLSLQEQRAGTRETSKTADPLSSLTVVNEAGEVVETITQRLKVDDLPAQPQDPVSLIERLIMERDRERKAAKKDQPSTST
jgi:hypothetical protein